MVFWSHTYIFWQSILVFLYVHLAHFKSVLNLIISFQRPLTRYLPVRNAEFDLRQHIESAGHQIELCVHLHLTSSSCHGYLHKLGSTWKTWKKRWFVFDRIQRALLYYSDKGETKLKGGVNFKVRFFNCWRGSHLTDVNCAHINTWTGLQLEEGYCILEKLHTLFSFCKIRISENIIILQTRYYLRSKCICAHYCTPL